VGEGEIVKLKISGKEKSPLAVISFIPTDYSLSVSFSDCFTKRGFLIDRMLVFPYDLGAGTAMINKNKHQKKWCFLIKLDYEKAKN